MLAFVAVRVPVRLGSFANEGTANVARVDIHVPRGLGHRLDPCRQDKLQEHEPKAVRLVPGQDTLLRADLPKNVLPFEDLPVNIRIRAAWLLRPRRRPRCPTFGSCPVPRYNNDNVENNSRLCLVYFRAWTGLPRSADEDVPHVADLQGTHETWEQALRTWLQALPCQETKQHVGNFLSVYRVRSIAQDAENSDNDDADTTGPYVDATNFRTTLRTRVPKKGAKEAQEENYDDLERTWARSQDTDEDASGVSLKKLRNQEHLDVDATLREARRRENEPDGPGQQPTPRRASTRPHGTQAQIEAVRAWLEDLKTRANSEGRRICNAEQHGFLSRVVDRLVHEMRTGEMQSGSRADEEDSLRWVLHGGPGTGKTHAIKLLRTELFEGILGWQAGIHFQMAALQAVTSDMLDGDTLHHCFGLTWGNGSTEQTSLTKGQELAKRLLQMRWLIIDEISMVSLELLARVERACRQLVRQGSPFKQAPTNNLTRPFGGLNVLVIGDLWQLDPPKGHCLADLPHEWLGTAASKQRLLLTQGQDLVWGAPECGFQGVTELTECERTKDTWLQDLQEEFRYSQLSSNSHAFLHGQPTTVPGSWLRGEAECGNDLCRSLVRRGASPSEILKEECAKCQEERTSRRLVANGPDDPRFLGHFLGAPSVFATNVRKCHINKIRAEAFAGRAEKELHYVVAQDCASAAVVREKPALAQEKLAWLQRHDRECGELCGMLPLCEGMPVFLTDHINRKRNFKLLKGRQGYVRGWQHATDGAVPTETGTVVWNQLPRTVLVHFPDATFQLPGLAKGVYPITPQRRTWFLDEGRKRPCLAVTRKQLPLLPAFAMTAHQAQGQTLEMGVIADLNYKAISGALTAYIAMTRVRSRTDLLILRAFDAQLFQQGDQSFRKLLLRHWRSHDIDWDVIVKRYIQTRPCCECRAERPKLAFTAGQWKRTDVAVCKECIQTYKERGTPHRCCRCQRWQAAEAFPGKVANFHVWQTTCLMCTTKRQCGTCDQWFDESAYTTHGWRTKRDRVCAGCRVALHFKHVGLRARERLRRRVAKTRHEHRKSVVEAVRLEIAASRKKTSTHVH